MVVSFGSLKLHVWLVHYCCVQLDNTGKGEDGGRAFGSLGSGRVWQPGSGCILAGWVLAGLWQADLPRAGLSACMAPEGG